jgi:hypothetical protein
LVGLRTPVPSYLQNDANPFIDDIAAIRDGRITAAYHRIPEAEFQAFGSGAAGAVD